MSGLHEICQKFFGDSTACSSVLMSYENRITRPSGGVSNTKMNQTLQFVNFVINSSEFIKHFGEQFERMRAKTFPDSEHSLEELKQTYLKSRVTKKQAFSVSDLEQYLKESDQFVRHYREIVDNVYKYYFNNTMSDEIFERVLERVRGVSFHADAFDLNECVHKIVRETVSPTDVGGDGGRSGVSVDDNHFQARYGRRFGGVPGMGEIRAFNEFMSDSSKVIDLYFENRYRRYNLFAERVMHHFFKVFERDITAFELVKYYETFATFTEEGGVDTDIADQLRMEREISQYHANFLNKFKKVSNIYNNYLNQSIEYDRFVKLYIDYMDVKDADYDTTIIGIVVHYDQYKLVMIEKVKSIYRNTFDAEISPNDLDYFYERAHRDQLSLVCESLPTVISALKEETDTFNKTIGAIMWKVLKREADLTEEIAFIAYFRYNTSNVNPDIRLENELYESLEYHDVLKSTISEEYCQERGLTVNRSDLFKMLTHILTLEDKLIKRDVRKVFALLDEYNQVKKN